MNIVEIQSGIMCTDNHRMLLGIATLRDLMVFRPAVREICTEMLLGYCTYLDKQTRTNAVNAAVMFVPAHPTLSLVIENAALKTLENLTNAKDINELEALELQMNKTEISPPDLCIKPDDQNGLENREENSDFAFEDDDGMDLEVHETPENPNKVSVTEIIQSRLDLFLACCAKKETLIDK